MKIIDANISIPKDCFLHKLTKLHGRQVRKASDGKLYTWDRLHGHIEKFNKNGFHLGVCDLFDKEKIIEKPVTGRTIKL